MPDLDLNAQRAARREATGDALVVRIGDDRFELPPELPIDLAEHIQALADGDVGSTTKIVEVLFGDDTETFMSYRPSVEDLSAIVEAYGANLGESPASTQSPANAGTA